MKVINTSDCRHAEVVEIARWALREMELEDYVEVLQVRKARHGGSGRCSGRRVGIRLSPDPRYYPHDWSRRFPERFPSVTIRSWQESLVALLGHEFQHSRQIRARTAARARGEDPSRAISISEVDADRAGAWLLHRWRGQEKASYEEAVARFEARQQEREAQVSARKAAARAPEVLRAKKLTDLTAKVARWERKRKTAETYLKKYRRALKRLGVEVNSVN